MQKKKKKTDEDGGRPTLRSFDGVFESLCLHCASSSLIAANGWTLVQPLYRFKRLRGHRPIIAGSHPGVTNNGAQIKKKERKQPAVRPSLITLSFKRLLILRNLRKKSKISSLLFFYFCFCSPHEGDPARLISAPDLFRISPRNSAGRFSSRQKE